jgi:hypothetical protein
MPKKNVLKAPSEKELQSIAELFLLAKSGLNHWGSDDSFLVNMGSISQEDIDEDGSEGRNQLLEILAMADLPKVSISDLAVKPDDLQTILPAVASVLEVFALPGLKKSTLKKFNEAVDATFAQVSLNTVSAEVEQKVGDIYKGLLNKSVHPKKSYDKTKKSLEPTLPEKFNYPFAVPSPSSHIIIVEYCDGYDCIGWYSNKKHATSVVENYYFNSFYYTVQFQGEAAGLATSESMVAVLLRKEFSIIRGKSEYEKCVPKNLVAEFVKWLEEAVVNKEPEFGGLKWNPGLDFIPDGIIGRA